MIFKYILTSIQITSTHMLHIDLCICSDIFPFRNLVGKYLFKVKPSPKRALVLIISQLFSQKSEVENLFNEFLANVPILYRLKTPKT